MAIRFQAAQQPFEPFRVLFGPPQSCRGYYRYSQINGWEPPVNIYEDSSRFYICAELAGLAKEEVTVEVFDRQIRIHGERAVPVPCQKMSADCILRIEIDSGRFFRAIELPASADLNSTAARLDQGFLWVTVEKHRSHEQGPER